ncbi:MAG: ACT domain-containing protein [Lachnospiraceae bacterium]|nr:ACT domain-containing protein [Lachnospiraceae bacterium]
MKKAIITVVGRDCVGIIAKVCTYLADSNINILDISQTIVGGYFNMMMVVEVGASAKSFDTISEELGEVGKTIGCVIRIQLEDIFDMMHRI